MFSFVKTVLEYGLYTICSCMSVALTNSLILRKLNTYLSKLLMAGEIFFTNCRTSNEARSVLSFLVAYVNDNHSCEYFIKLGAYCLLKLNSRASGENQLLKSDNRNQHLKLNVSNVFK